MTTNNTLKTVLPTVEQKTFKYQIAVTTFEDFIVQAEDLNEAYEKAIDFANKIPTSRSFTNGLTFEEAEVLYESPQIKDSTGVFVDIEDEG
jgi:hypothetical protein